MPGSVLIIDADEDFAGRLKSTLEAHGASVQTTGDGRVGLDMARQDIPNAIVVCVELPRMSGYSICAKIKKDPSLKTVTLVITSAEATQETFEHHKKLKNRAEEYLRKPFEPHALSEVLGRYIQLDVPSPEPIIESDLAEDVISEEVHIEPEPAEVIEDQEAFSEDRFHFDDVPAAGIDASVAVEPADPPVGDEGAGLVDTYEEDEVMTTVGVVPSPGNEILFKEIEQLRAELDAERDAHAQSVRDRDEALANERAAVGQLQSLSTGAPSQITASRDLLAIKKELHDRDKQLLELRDAVQEKERALLEQRDREMQFESQLVQVQEELEGSQQRGTDLEGQLVESRQRIADLEQAGRDAAAAAEQQMGELRGEISQLTEEIETHKRTAAAQDDEISSLRTTNQALNGEVTRMNNEVSATLAESAELREQLAAAQLQVNQLDQELTELRQKAESTGDALEATKASLIETEEQAARAFERIRREGETKTKVRQALDIALRLLTEADEDGIIEDGAAAEEIRP